MITKFSLRSVNAQEVVSIMLHLHRERFWRSCWIGTHPILLKAFVNTMRLLMKVLSYGFCFNFSVSWTYLMTVQLRRTCFILLLWKLSLKIIVIGSRRNNLRLQQNMLIGSEIFIYYKRLVSRFESQIYPACSFLEPARHAQHHNLDGRKRMEVWVIQTEIKYQSL